MLRNIFLFAFAACAMGLVPFIAQFGADDARRSGNVGAARSATGVQSAAVEQSTPAPAAQSDGALSGRKVTLDADARGHFVSDFKLNGARVTAMVDTGATMLAINASTARRIGLSLSNGDFTHSVDTANGRAKAAVATIARVEIGRISIDNVQALVLEDRALSGVLVGMTFLNRLRKFQVEDGTLVMQQ